MKKLEIDILVILLEKKSRPCEIRKLLSLKHPQYHDHDRIFDVIISRKLKKLKEDGLVDKTEIKRQNVSYTITPKGKFKLISDYNKKMSLMLPEGNIHIEVLRFLMHLKILIVDILTPDGAPLSEYVKNLRNVIDDSDLPAQFTELLNDPGKGYLEFSKYLDRYEKKRMQIAIARLKQQNQ